MEALRRARYKFPGRQKIIVSKKWGFTSLDRADYEALKRDKLVINDGAYVQVSRYAGEISAVLTISSSSQRESSSRTSELLNVLLKASGRYGNWWCCTSMVAVGACIG